jgi:D-amino-acid dehydrogenase
MGTLPLASGRSVIVVGAGIVGLCAALHLQRSGCQVAVYDEQQPGGGTSYGNGGLLSPGSCMPIAMPGMLRKVPGWIADPTGPLAVNPRHLVAAAPWLYKWIRAGRLPEVYRAADALNKLHSTSLQAYRDLLGDVKFHDLIRVSGQVHVWESEAESAGDLIYAEMREKYGIETEDLSASELHDLSPGLSLKIKRAMLFPKHGYTVNPFRLVQTLGELLVEAGGSIKQERVMKLLPASEGGFRLLTNLSDVRAEKVLVSAGIWSKELLAPLGVNLPFEPQRGYHIQVVNPSVDVRIPVLHKERAIGAIAMEGGLRFVGTVEIAGLKIPMDERREEAMLANARALFPKLEFESSSLWMGFRPSTPDSVPVLSRVNETPGLYIAAGHGHTGITAGAPSGRLIAEMMTGGKLSIDPEPYRLSRF